MNLQAFSADDWYAFAGASKFASGEGPFIAHSKEGSDSYVIIVSATANGASEGVIEVIHHHHDEFVSCYQLVLATEALTQRVATSLSHGDLQPETLKCLGFDCIA